MHIFPLIAHIVEIKRSTWTDIYGDSSGKPIGVVWTILMEDFAPGDKIGFEATASSMPPSITIENVENVKSYSYPMQMQF